MRAIPLLLVLFALPAVAQTPLTPLTSGLAVRGQGSPSIASDGDRYFVMWSDTRSTVAGQLFGSIADPSGHLLQPYGTPISRIGTSGRALVWNGEAFVAAFTTSANSVGVVRIDRNGQPIDRTPVAVVTKLPAQVGAGVAAAGARTILIASSFTTGITGAIVFLDRNLQTVYETTWNDAALAPVPAAAASDGESYLIVGATSFTEKPKEMAARIVSPAGFAQPSRQIVIPTATDVQAIGAAWTGRDYLLVWSDLGRGVFARRIARDGMPASDAVAVSDDATVYDLSIASRGDDSAVVVWTTRASTTTGDIHSAGIDSYNVVSIATVAASPYPEDWPTVSASRSGFMAAWTSSSLATAPLLASGARADGVDPAAIPAEQVMSSTIQVRFATDALEPSDLALWEEEDGAVAPHIQIKAKRGSGSPYELSPSPRVQRAPATASSRNTRLIVWLEQLSPGSFDFDVMGQLFTTDGSSALGTPFRIGAAAFTERFFYDPATGDEPPAIIWDGRQYIVAAARWIGGGIKLYRVTESGAVLDPEGVDIPDVPGPTVRPAFARAAGTTLLVWQTGPNEAPICPIMCLPPPPTNIYGMRLGIDGLPISTTPFLISEGTDYELRPAIATNGIGFLVAWTTRGRLHARLFTRDGVGTGPGVIDLGPAAQYAWPSAGFDGHEYVLAWEDGDALTNHYDISTARVTLSGAVHGFFIAPSTTRQRRPVLWSRPGETVVAYEQVDEWNPEWSTPRIFVAPLVDLGARRRIAGRTP